LLLITSYKDYMKYNFEMIWNGGTVCPENWGMKNEIATFHRVYYVYGGEAYCNIDDKVIRLEKGHLYLLPVMHEYSMWHNPENPLDVLWFHVETDIRLCVQIEDIKIEENTVIYNLFEAVRIITDDSEHYEELLEIFGIILSFAAEKIPFNTMSSKRMQSVMKYIDNNYGDPELDVDTLAELVKMDRSSFSRKFKKAFNIAPKQYIYAKRMNKAAQELARGASVYQAGNLVGYLDEKSFSRAFKRYMEVTPSEYRKCRVTLP